MKLRYKSKSIELINCKSFYSRLMGFMFKEEIDYALLFDKCNSIHTFFMKKNIDVIMCDKNNKVIYYYKNLGKNKIILPKFKVSKVFELPVNYFDIRINDKVIIEE